MKDNGIDDFKMMVKTSGWTGVGKFTDVFLRYSTSIVLTRTLGIKAFGIFVLSRTLVMVIGLVCKFGMGYGVVRQIAFFSAKKDEINLQQSIRLAILIPGIISIIAVFLLFWGGEFISILILKESALVMPLKWMIFSIPVITGLHILLDVLRGFKKINSRVLLENYLLPLSNLFFILIFYFLGYRLTGAICAFMASNFLILLILIFLNQKKIKMTKPKPFLIKKASFDFFKFSLPLSFLNVLAVLKNRLDILFLGLLSSVSNTSIFFIALKMAGLLAIPWQASNMIFSPMVSGFYARNEIEKIEFNYKNITKIMFIFGTSLGGFLLVFSQEILSIFGTEFKKGGDVVLLVCLGQVIKTSVGNAGPMLAMIGRPSLNLLIMVITLTLLIILNLILIPSLGIIGAGIANLIVVTVSSILELYFIYNSLRIHPFKRDFIKPVIAALVSIGGISLIKKSVALSLFSTLFLMICFIFLFFICLYLQGFSPEEAAMINSIKQKILNWKLQND